MDTKRDLWLRLKNYQFVHLAPPQLLDRVQAAFGGPDASTHAFADKLARKLRWSAPFALRAIDEYRKFVYLGLIADFPVTPPKVIDQVWHEHLLFSRAYREFCASVLRREFDHNPELVPLDEQTAEFRAQFAETRALYRTEFDREPPAEFWGVAKFTGRPEPSGVGKLRRKREDRSAAAYEYAPLYAYFSGSSDSGSHAHPTLPEFGGGESGGGGGGEVWSDSTSSGGHGDAGGASDGGSSDGGGSGCSSGCGSS